MKSDRDGSCACGHAMEVDEPNEPSVMEGTNMMRRVYFITRADESRKYGVYCRHRLRKLLIVVSVLTICVASLVAGSGLRAEETSEKTETLSFWAPNKSFSDVTLDGAVVQATVFSLLERLPMPDDDGQSKSFDRSAGMLLRIPSKSLLILVDIARKTVNEVPIQVLQRRTEDMWELTVSPDTARDRTQTALSIHLTTQGDKGTGQKGTLIEFNWNDHRISMLKIKKARAVNPGNQTNPSDPE